MGFVVVVLFCWGLAFCCCCLFFKKPCPSANLLGFLPHPLLPHSICLLYHFLALAPVAFFPLLPSVILTSFWFLSAMSHHLYVFILSSFPPHSNPMIPHPHRPAAGDILPQE